MSLALEIDGVSKRFGGLWALSEVSFRAEPGLITGLIGQNGAGKTTLINIISQQVIADSGTVRAGKTLLTGLPSSRVVAAGVARSYQQLRIFANLTTLDNVALAFPDVKQRESMARALFAPTAVAREDAAIRERASAILDKFELANVIHITAGDLSYGQQKQLSLARLEATGASILLIDEPTSGLSTEAIKRIRQVVASFREQEKTVVLVEHDMEVLFALADTIVVLDHGRVIRKGPAEEIRHDPEVKSIYLGGAAHT